jgi:hypothetical protein
MRSRSAGWWRAPSSTETARSSLRQIPLARHTDLRVRWIPYGPSRLRA